jgi:hypothetical protein
MIDGAVEAEAHVALVVEREPSPWTMIDGFIESAMQRPTATST